MANVVRVIANTSNAQTWQSIDVEPGSGQKGNPARLKAMPGTKYQLQDLSNKNLGPKNLRTQRVGKNLHVMMGESVAPDLIVEGYFDEVILNNASQGLYGMSPEGQWLPYVTDPTTLADATQRISLTSGAATPSTLTGSVVTDFAVTSAATPLAVKTAVVLFGAALGTKDASQGADNSAAKAAKALAGIAEFAQTNTQGLAQAQGTPPDAATYLAAGVTGVDASNLGFINDSLATAAVDGAAANTKLKLQAIANACRAILAAAQGPAGATANVSAADFTLVGLTGVDSANKVSLLGHLLSGSGAAAANSVAKLQVLSDAVAAVMAAAAGGLVPTLAQMQALGMDVTADNLAAVQAAIAATADDGSGVSTRAGLNAVIVAGQAALNKIEAYNNGNGTIPLPLTASDYVAAGITGVDEVNITAVNARVLAAATGGADTAPEIQALVAGIQSAVDKIEAYNNGNGTTPAALTLQDYVDAGVTGVKPDNLVAVNAKVLAATTGGANSSQEIQALVQAADAAIAKIEAFNNGDGTTPAPLSVADYAAAGITGVTADNVAAMNATVLAKNLGEADTPAKVQALLATADAALNKIEAYNNGNGTTPSALTLQDYANAGVSGVSADNLAAVNAKVLSAATGGANSGTEIQALVNAGNDALNKIEDYNNGNGTTPSALTLQDYADAGIRGVSNDNLAALNATVLAQVAGGANTVARVQSLVGIANVALGKIEAYNNGNGTTPAPLSLQDYALAGVSGVSADNLVAVNAKVLAAATGGANSAAEIQALVQAANSALAKIEAYNNGDGTTPAPLSVADYQAAGITGVNPSNLAALNAQVLAQSAGGAHTAPHVQSLVSVARAALAKIEAYNNGDGLEPPALAVQDYAAVGVTGVSADNLAAVNAQVLVASLGGAQDVRDIQTLVTAGNAALAKIEAFNNGNGSTPPALALSDYQAAGITGVSADNLAAVNAKVLASATGGANTVAKVQTLVTAGNLALNKIEAYNNGDGTTPASLTAQDYADAGVTGVSDDNVAAVNAQVLRASMGSANTVSEVQSWVAQANAALATIEAFNNGNGINPPVLSLADYQAAGITGVSADNLAAVNAKVLAAATGGADTVAKVQTLVTAGNLALNKIEAYNNGDGTTPAALTAQDYADAGLADVTADNVVAVNAHVLAAARGGAATVTQVQALVAVALEAIAKVERYNNGDGSSPSALSVADYAAAGITGVSAGNLSSVNARVLASAVTGTDTAPKIQDVVNAVNAALDKIEAYNQGNGSVPAALVLQDYVDAGIGGVSADNLAAVNAQVLAQNIGGAHSSLQLNTLVGAANAALAKIEAYNNGNGTTPAALTVADYEAAGITGVSDNNVASVTAKVLAAIPGATNSVNEVQNLVNALNLGLVKIEAYNRGDGTTPFALSTQDYADAGIAGVSSDNLAAVNAQVLRQNDGGADSVFKVQNLVTLADAALAKIEAYNNGNGTTPAALVAQDYADAGVTGVSIQNIAAVNAKVLAAGMGGANSVDEIQAFANGVNDALVKIEAYNRGDGVTPSSLSIQDYEAAGVSGVSADNLAAVNAQVLAAAATGADTPGEVQALVTAANSALAKIEAYNSDTPTPLALTLADYAAAGIGGVSVDNLAAVNAQVLAAIQGAADSVGDIAYLVSLASDALAKIEAYNNGNGTTPTALTLQDYDAAGITGVTAGNLAAVNAQVLAKSPLGADTVGEVQAIVLEANAAIDKIEAYNNGDGTTPAALVAADYAAAGVTGVNADNLAIINAKVLAAAVGATDTGPKIQSFADGVNNALVKIEAYNNGDGITPVALTLPDFAAAGISGVSDANLAAVNAQLLAAAAGGANTVSKVQALVTGAGNALAKIEAYNNGNGTMPVALTVADYEAAGVTGVNSDNLAAVNTQVLAQDIGGADSVLKVQILADAVNLSIAKIEAYNNGNGITPVALTVQDYAALGLTTVTVGNVAAVNAQVLAKPAGGANSVAEIQACVTAGIAAVAKIEAYNNGNGTTPAALVAQDYADAGITGVNTDNLAAVNARVLAAATGAADTVAEIQAFANATLAAIAKIEAYNNGNGITPVALTITDYEAAGVSNVSAGNLAAVNAQVLAQGVGGANAVAEIQACVAAGIAAIAKVEAYNNGNGTTPAALAVADYEAAGITGVNTDNVAAVNAKVLAANPGAADTVAEIQALASAVNTALAKIEAYNNGDGITPAALSVADYAAVGITVTGDNLAAVNAKVLSATIGGADSVSEVQALVTAAVNALANIEAYNNGNGTTPAALLVTDYTTAGITGVNADNLAAVNAKVLAQIPGGADTAPEVQALVNGINTALNKIEAYNNGDGVTPAALTAADYSAAGISGVSDANVAAVNAKVLAAATGSADSVSDVQALVAAAAIALNKIEDYNNGNGTTPSALIAQDYADAGITGVTNNNVAAVNAQVLAASTGGADTSFEVQGLVTAANNALAKIEAFNDGNGTIPSALSLADYQAAGISGVSADNLAAVNAQVLVAVSGAANTVPEINALVVLADAALAKIEAYNNGNGTTPAALSVSDYEAAGITGVNADGVAVINAKVLNQTTGGANTVPKVQAIADGVNTALAKIEAYNNGNGTTPAALTAQDYADAGIANVTADNVVAVNAQVLDQATGGANSVSEVQGLVTVAIAALNKIEAYNNGDGTTPALDLADYQAAGITGVTNNNLAAVNAQVLAAAVGDANSVSEVQALVTAGNNALAKIEAYNNGNGTNPAALTAQDYAAAGITGVSAGNVVAVNAKVLAAATSGADTVGEVQALVNAANSALAKIEAYNNGNGTTPPALSVTDYDVIGVTGVTANNVAAVNAQVLAQNSGGANSVPAIQALVSTANAALAKIEAYNNGNGSSPSALTVADYVAAGITGVTLDNVAAANVQVLAQSTGGADTVPDIQALIVGANTALAKIAAYSNGNGTTPAALTQSDYEAAGLTGVSAANLLAVNAKVLGQPTGGADSVPEIQGCVDFALSALAKIEAYNNGNGLTPAALIDQDYVDAAVQGVSADNLAAVNAQVLAAAPGGANSVSQVQALVTAGNNALAKIEAYNNGNGTNPLALTVQDYEAAGITGVNSGNVAAVNAGVLAANPGEANTVAEIQTLVSGAGYALAKIEAYNNGDGSSPVALTVADYQAAGITGVSSTNVAAVNAQVLASAPGGATSVAQVQALVSAGNAALAKIEAYNNGNGSTPAALAVADYVAAGITGVSANNVTAVNAQVLAAASGGADNVPKVQTLVLAGNAALAKIEAYNNGDGTTPAALTEADYAAAGITDVIADNVVAVNAQVLARAAGGANTAPQVQTLVVAANAALAKIEAYNNGNGTTPAALVEADYQAIGVTGVTADNLAAVNAKVVAAPSGGADTVAEIQAIANGVTQALAKIEAYNNGNGSSPSALSVADYEAAGITGVSADNLLAVNAQVLGAATGGADSVSDVQAWVTVATNAMAALAQAAQNNTAVSSQLAPANFAAVGVTGVSQGNVGALQSVLDSAAVVGTSVDSVAKIQAIVNAYQAIVLNADGTANNNVTHPSQAQYALLGVTGVNSAVKESLLGDVVDSQSFANVDTVAKLQTLVAKVQHVMDVAALDNTHTFFVGNTPDGSGNTEITVLRASLEALGLTGLNAQNMGAVWMAVRDSANAGTGVDTLSKLQTLINAANDQPTIVNVNVAISTLEDTPTVFKIADAVASHISDADGTGVKGIAINWNQTSTAQGTWAYSSDNLTWTDLPVYLSQGNSLTNTLYLNATDFLRYTPLANKNGAPGNLFFRAVDASFADTASGTTGFDVSDYNKTGQSMTEVPLYFVLSVTAVNDAPVLADTVLTLTAVAEDAVAPVGAVGNLVPSLTNGVSDVDGVSVPKGIAITATDTSNGQLFYSTDAGVTWRSVGVVSTASALLLASDANTRLYFQPSANFNGTVSDVLTFVAWDQTSGTAGTKVSTALKGGATAFSTASDTVALTVNAVNDAPVIDTAANTFTIVEDSSTSFVIRDQLAGKMSDVDGTALKGIAIAQNTSTNGTWAWSTDGVSWTNFPSTYLGTLDWTQLLYLNATDRLRFTPNANANGTGLGALSFVAVDSSFANTSSGTQISGSGSQGGSGALSSQSGSFAVDVTAVNDAPTHTVPGAQTTNEDTAKVISGLQIADVDAGSSIETVTLSVAHGTLTVLAGTGVTLGTNGTASVTLTGTVSAINTLLATASAVTYTPTLNYTGSDTLTMVTNDGGNTGSGGAQTATSTVAITVTAVNDQPVVVNANLAISGLEEATYSTQVSALVAGQFTDVDSGASIIGVAVSWVSVDPAAGTWQYSSDNTNWTAFPADMVGTAGTFNQLGKAVYLSASSYLRFVPVSNYTGVTGSLIFRGVDNSMPTTVLDTSLSSNVTLATGVRVNVSSYNGSTGAMSSSPIGLAYTLTAVNDAPTLSVTSANPTFTEGAGSSQANAISLFSGSASATGPANEASQAFTQLTVTVSGLADGANEVLRVNGTLVALTHGTSGTTATNAAGYSVSVTGSTATVTVTTPVGNQSAALIDSIVNNLAYQNTAIDNPTAGNRVVTITRLSDNGGTANSGQDTATLSLASTVTVAAVNDAPVLDAAQSPVLAAIATTATAPTNGNTTAGVLVNTLIAGVSDVDSTALGIVITAAASGTVYYSLNGGTTWSSVASTSLTTTNALRLAADTDTRLYFQPTTLTAGTTASALTIRAWDQSAGTEGTFVNTTTTGGTTPFSSATDTVSQSVVTPAAVSSVAITGATGIANSTLNVGDVVTVTVTYNGAVTVSGTPQLALVIGASTVQATYTTTGSTSTSLKFTYTVLANQTDTDGISLAANALSQFSGSTIVGSNGVAASLSTSAVSANVGYLVDTTAPTATLTNPGSLGTSGTAVVQSSEIGTAYLVDSTATVTDEASILALADASYNSVAIASANTSTNLYLTGLSVGTYKLYAVDKAGNLSAVATNTINVVPGLAAVNLSAVGTTVGGLMIQGEVTNANYAGSSVANAGDVNGDGYNDVVVGARGVNAGAGRVYVVFGGNSSKVVDLADINAGIGGFAMDGEVAANNVGIAVSGAGDLNGDGLADLIMGAPGYSSSSGKSYVVFGRAGTSALSLGSLGTAGFAINAQAANDYSGVSLSAAGDVNGDGYADLIVGAYGSGGTWAGKSYVLFGRASWGTVNLASLGTGGFAINGEAANDYSGISVSSAGDVNGDGLADLIVGAYAADPVGATDGGKSYVVFGTTSSSAINLSALTAGTSSLGFVINGGAEFDNSGNSVSNAGDVNGDGLADLIVGAPIAIPGTALDVGISYVVFGKANSTVVNLSALGTGGFVINGQMARDYSGSSVSTLGDFNGDGLADLIVSAPSADPLGRSNAGKTYVVFGTTSTTAINLSAIEGGIGGFVLNGELGNDKAGDDVSAAGDVNGDGFADLLVSSMWATVGGNGSKGKAYVIFGGTQYASLANPIDFVGTAAPETLTGTANGQTFMAGDGDDTLIGFGGADVMNGGRGNDTLVVNASNITGLRNNFGAGDNTTQLARVDGGTGYDTLRLAQGAGNFDLTAISNVDAMAGDGTSRFNSIERIDLATDTAANTLTIAARDVNDMAGFNLIRTGAVSADGNTWTNVSGTALSATTKFHQMVVDGSNNDSVTLAAGAGTWASAGQVSNDGGTTLYNVYQNVATNSQVIVKAGLGVTNNDPAPPAAGDPVIDLGTSGKLIAPVLVEGKWYYYWDRSGDGTSADAGSMNGGTDFVNSNTLDLIFNQDINGGVNPGADSTETFRYATINGIRLALPTINGGLPVPGLSNNFARPNGTTAVGTGSANNSSFDELLAIWDTHNGTSTANNIPGLPTGWGTGSRYLSASGASGFTNRHFSVALGSGTVDLEFDAQALRVALQVLPVVIDLNRDGVLSYGQVTMDVNGDGLLDTTKWAGKQDGVLIWDKYADGLVHDNSQYAFAQYAKPTAAGFSANAPADFSGSEPLFANEASPTGVGSYKAATSVFSGSEPLLANEASPTGVVSYKAATDLSGLADAFDTNHDGVFSADDAKFAEFKVWQDINQNGVSDAGEVRSLAEWGIADINLSSDGVVRTPTAGVTEAGRTTATATDGTQVLVSDAGFEFSSLAYSATTVDGLGTHIDLLGSGMQLDLSRFIAQHAQVSEVDLTGTGANTLKLNLGDVLENTPLKLMGDADDAVLLNAGDWVNTGEVRSDSGHTYALYNANNTQTHQQLWLDPHMMVLSI